jgi:predicted DNA-binding transcriptional regulator YafY
MRGTQISRQWKILRLIESRWKGLTAKELSNELESDLRTVYRDLDALQNAGFPLYTKREGRSSKWRVVEGYKSDLPLPVTVTELMALHLSRDILRIFDGTVFQESIESLFHKVKASLPPDTIRYLNKISQRVTVGFGPPKYFETVGDIISRVADATGRRKRVEILYKAASTGKETLRKVDPYRVCAMNGGFYLIGLCRLRNSVRTFALERVKKLSMLDESFHYPEDFSLDEYLQTAFRVMRGDPETVTVRFAPGAARVVRERIWHPTQEIREQEDGSLIITLEVPINYEVISWILGFGSAAEVLQPESLRRTILEELEAGAERYRPTGLAETKTVRAKKISATLS